NRFEVLFRGTEQEVSTSLTREILSAMTLQRFSGAMWHNYQQAQLQQGDQSRRYTRAADYIGRVPARYTVRQFVGQWTPQLNRRFSIPVSADRPVEFDWNAFADAETYNARTAITDGPARDKLLRPIKKALG